MRVVILLNGEPHRGEICAENSYVICCDGAYSWAKGRVHIDENLGDFDSLGETPYPPPRAVFPAEKNETDGELALGVALDMGATEIVLYGGGGLREDHFLGNLHLLYKAQQRGVRSELVTNGARIFCAEGRVELNGLKGRTVSVTPFGGRAHIMESNGLKYPMNGLDLVYGATRGISNVVAENKAHFVSQGTVLVFINQEWGRNP